MHPHRNQLAVAKQPYLRAPVGCARSAAAWTSSGRASWCMALITRRALIFSGAPVLSRTAVFSRATVCAGFAALTASTGCSGDAFRVETNRGQRNSHHAAALGRDDVRIGRHAGKERQIVVFDVDYDIVGHDVLHGDGALANLAD